MTETCKKSITHDDYEGGDLISELTDEILTRILSFLDTKSVLATSVLSKRWQLVWASVPNLEFYYTWSVGNMVEHKARLGNLVDRVLSLNNVMYVRTVRLACFLYSDDVLRVNAWFKSLVARKADMFYLHMPRSFLDESLVNASSLPVEFFNQKNLVELAMSHVVVKVPSVVRFPRLKTLSFKHVHFCDDEPVINLLSGCPSITNLRIRPLGQVHYKKLYLCSSTLEHITIHICYDEMVFDTPNVEYLDLNIQATTRALGRSTLLKIATLHNLTHIMLSGIELQEEVSFWLRLLARTPHRVGIIFKLVDPGMFGSPSQSSKLPHSILSCIESIKITNKRPRKSMSVITCNLKSAAGSEKLFIHGFPISKIHEDEQRCSSTPWGVL